MSTMKMWGVYRVLRNGTHRYLSGSVTGNEKLAKEIAAERSAGECTLPYGRVVTIRAYPHIAKPIGEPEPVRVVRKGSYRGVPQWGISTSPEMTPSKATATKWATLENHRRGS